MLVACCSLLTSPSLPPSHPSSPPLPSPSTFLWHRTKLRLAHSSLRSPRNLRWPVTLRILLDLKLSYTAIYSRQHNWIALCTASHNHLINQSCLEPIYLAAFATNFGNQKLFWYHTCNKSALLCNRFLNVITPSSPLLLTLTTQEVLRFSMYISVPIFSSCIYANPERMHYISKSLTRSNCIHSHINLQLLLHLILLKQSRTWSWLNTLKPSQIFLWAKTCYNFVKKHIY